MTNGSLLHLTQLETKKLLTGRTFYLAGCFFLLSMVSTFVSLSFTSGFVESLTGQTMNVLPQDPEMLEIMEFTQDLLTNFTNGDLPFSFVQSMYAASNGIYVVVLVYSIVHILADFSYGTAKQPLLCGYSRQQYYLAKLISNVLAGYHFLLFSMILFTIIGVVFYGTELTMSLVSTYLLVVLAQCVVLTEHVAIYTAFGFLCRNGWAFALSILTLIILPGLPLATALLRGADHSFIFSLLPTYVSLSGIDAFYSLDQLAALPQLWTAPYLVAAMLVAVVIITAFTALGMRSFSHRNL